MGFVLATSVWADGGHAGRVTLPAGGGGALGDRALPGAVVPTVWAHQPYVMHMAVTNRTAAMRTVTKVTTSCVCLTAKAVDGGGREATALPGGVIPFELTLNPTGLEGRIAKTVSVTFDDGTVETMTVELDVRTRLALSPSDAAFGVVRVQGAAVAGLPPYREMRLVGCAVTNGGARIVGLVSPENPKFDVRVAADGLGVVVGSAHHSSDRFAAASPVDNRADRRTVGLVVETWNLETTDAEVPKIPFVVSAQFADGISVSPSVLTVDGGGRGATALPVSRVVTIRRDDRRAFKVQDARTMPRKWGDVVVEKRPLNGWMIRITGIDPRELAQFSKRPYLEVRTDCPEMENFEIPIRVMRKGNGK